MKHDKTFDAIAKLKDVEIELHRLKNLLEMTGKALDAKSEWVGLTDEEKQEAYYKIDLWSECVAFIEAKLKQKNI
jgi:hypothetical protein